MLSTAEWKREAVGVMKGYTAKRRKSYARRVACRQPIRALLMAQGRERIHAFRPACGDPARQERNSSKKQRHGREGRHVVRTNTIQDASGKLRHCPRGGQAERHGN